MNEYFKKSTIFNSSICSKRRDVISDINRFLYMDCKSNYYLDCLESWDELKKMQLTNPDCYKTNENKFNSKVEDFIVIKQEIENADELAAYIHYEILDDSIYISYSCTGLKLSILDYNVWKNEKIENMLKAIEDEEDDYEKEFMIDFLENIKNDEAKDVYEIEKYKIMGNGHREKGLSTILRIFIMELAIKEKKKKIYSFAISEGSKKALNKLGFKMTDEKIMLSSGINQTVNMYLDITRKTYLDYLQNLKKSLKICKQ